MLKVWATQIKYCNSIYYWVEITIILQYVCVLLRWYCRATVAVVFYDTDVPRRGTVLGCGIVMADIWVLD